VFAIFRLRGQKTCLVCNLALPLANGLIKSAYILNHHSSHSSGSKTDDVHHALILKAGTLYIWLPCPVHLVMYIIYTVTKVGVYFTPSLFG
jgi:hypothetical protein